MVVSTPVGKPIVFSV